MILLLFLFNTSVHFVHKASCDIHCTRNDVLTCWSRRDYWWQSYLLLFSCAQIQSIFIRECHDSV